MKKLLKPLLPFSLLLLLLVSAVQAGMSSTNYRITSSVLAGGGGSMSSTNFSTSTTLGQPGPTGFSLSSSFLNDSGFWATILYVIVGDVNGDGSVGLEDVITALQVATGHNPEVIVQMADADGDGRIGLGEAIMVLRSLSGL
jgi:hypothetical protein